MLQELFIKRSYFPSKQQRLDSFVLSEWESTKHIKNFTTLHTDETWLNAHM